MKTDFLDTILQYKKSLLEQKKAFFASLKNKIKNDDMPQYHIFKNAISKPGELNLIAEIKKASPSKGIICKNFDVLRLAETYRAGGAAALSIITEDKFFLGKVSYVRQVSENYNIPVLMKDFIIDEVQIYEAFYFGASAVLLIVALLDDRQLAHLISIASRVDLDCLVEVHDENELERALKSGAQIIGVNNRDLRTFEVDFSVCKRILPLVPDDKITVAESGIKSHDEIKALKDMGTNAVLIGETFLRSDDIAQKIKEIIYGEN